MGKCMSLLQQLWSALSQDRAPDSALVFRWVTFCCPVMFSKIHKNGNLRETPSPELSFEGKISRKMNGRGRSWRDRRLMSSDYRVNMKSRTDSIEVQVGVRSGRKRLYGAIKILLHKRSTNTICCCASRIRNTFPRVSSFNASGLSRYGDTVIYTSNPASPNMTAYQNNCPPQ